MVEEQGNPMADFLGGRALRSANRSLTLAAQLRAPLSCRAPARSVDFADPTAFYVHFPVAP